MTLRTQFTALAAVACILAPSIGLAQSVPTIDSVDPVHGTKLMSTEGFTYEVSGPTDLASLLVEIAPQGGATAITLDLPVNAAALAAYYTASGNPESQGIVALAVQNTSASQAVWSIEFNTAHPEWQAMLEEDPTSNVTFTATATDITPATGGTTTVHKLVNADLVDYDYDGMADKALRMQSGAIRWLRSSDAEASPAGEVVEDAVAVAGDFDGDGRDDQTWFKAEDNQCEWHTIPSSEGGTPQVFYFGPGDGCIPAVGDFDGDGADDFGVQRPSDGKIIHWPSTSASRMRGADRAAAGETVVSGFGDAESVPAVGDYDGDGFCDNVWYRPGPGLWRMDRSSAGWKPHTFGGGDGSLPAPGDYDGDGKTDLAVLRSDNRIMWMESSKVGSRRLMPPNGDPQRVAWLRLFADAEFVLADYNGDGISDPTWVKANGDRHQWFHRMSRRDGDTVRYARTSPV
ncbi:MAG: VCBS repeat-containing protein, partial [Verrucomicrobia bacterium]|nr:VCBS repeat-containing protein [Verrucomicrobiota bacterium]